MIHHIHPLHMHNVCNTRSEMWVDTEVLGVRCLRHTQHVVCVVSNRSRSVSVSGRFCRYTGTSQSAVGIVRYLVSCTEHAPVIVVFTTIFILNITRFMFTPQY